MKPLHFSQWLTNHDDDEQSTRNALSSPNNPNPLNAVAASLPFVSLAPFATLLPFAPMIGARGVQSALSPQSLTAHLPASLSTDATVSGSTKAGSGGNGSGAGSTGGTAGTSTTGAGTSPFVLNIIYDSSVDNAPAAFKTAITNAVKYLESQFTTKATVNISVGWGEVGGATLLPGQLGACTSFLTSCSYSKLKSALKSTATSAADTSSTATLGASNPTGGSLWLTTANAKALGLSTDTRTLDGYVGFSSSNTFDFNPANGITAGTYDFNGAALHELSEVLGRMMLEGSTIGSTANSYTALDLFHYTAPGVIAPAGTLGGYFSVDGGKTDLGDFNTIAGGDVGDWANAMVGDSGDAFTSANIVNVFGNADTTVMDAIGWTVAPTHVSIALADDTGASASDGITSDDTLSGLTTAGAVVSVYHGSTLLGSTVAAANGIWTFAPTGLAQGAQTLTASTTVGGTTAQASATFTYDTLAPAVSVVLVSATSQGGTSSTDALKGTADPLAQVTISDAAGVLGTATADASGAWSYQPLGLVAGDYTFVASATDAAGNTGSASLSVAYAPPQLSPTGIALAASAGALATATGSAGLNANASLAAVTERGGVAGDVYTYSLSGAGASAFALAAADGGAMLSTGTSGVAGANNGRAYLLSLSASDTTNGTASPAVPLGVIVGAGAGDTIKIASLLGSPSMPAFIYGLAGADTIDGSGMSGALFIDGGAGADRMTGSSGADVYLYSATAESTAKAMDVITNFDPGQDLFDFVGLGKTLTYVGQLSASASSLQAGAIGWLESGGNTFVYVNAGGKAENLNGTDTKIELLGCASLSSQNFAHL